MTTLIRPALKFLSHICSLGREARRVDPIPDRRMSGVSAVDEEPASAKEPGMIDPRVKEIYRRLVRRLHPDLRADGDATVSSVWHEVQEAYAAGDVARMELLLALIDLSNAPGASTTLSADALGS